MQQKNTIFWFRRDLRLDDNAGLYHALKSGNPVLGLFIFDPAILDKLTNKQDTRVTFIYDTIKALLSALPAPVRAAERLNGEQIQRAFEGNTGKRQPGIRLIYF